VARTKGALKALGYENKLDVILTQFVRVLKNGQEMKMSKRAGTYVSIDDLIEEVGCDATRFFFLMHSADTHMNLIWTLQKKGARKIPFIMSNTRTRELRVFCERRRNLFE